jgi:hypothetical protein
VLGEGQPFVRVEVVFVEVEGQTRDAPSRRDLGGPRVPRCVRG